MLVPEFLDILQPGEIPNAEMLRVSHDRSTRERCLTLRLNAAPWTCNKVAAQELYSLLSDWRFKSTQPAQPVSTKDDDIHDQFFYIRRVVGDHREIFFRMVIWTNSVFLRDIEEAPFSLSIRELDALDHAFMALESWALGISITQTARVKTWKRSSAPYQSMLRWIRGHQIFAALTQGLIVAFSELAAAISRIDVSSDQNGSSVESGVDFVVALLHGSRAALEFTGDVPPEDYLNIIRPSMTPPLVPETFSGLLSTDHRRLMHVLRQIKPSLDLLQTQFPDDHQRLAQAFLEMYESHKFVCERLVGKSPSLMMSTGVSAKSGVEELDKFKARRMKVFETRSAESAVSSAPSPRSATLASSV
jgi:hypothetical protein